MRQRGCFASDVNQNHRITVVLYLNLIEIKRYSDVVRTEDSQPKMEFSPNLLKAKEVLS